MTFRLSTSLAPILIALNEHMPRGSWPPALFDRAGGYSYGYDAGHSWGRRRRALERPAKARKRAANRAKARLARKARKATRFSIQRFGRNRRMEDLRLKMPTNCPHASLFYINHRQRIQGGTAFLHYMPGPMVFEFDDNGHPIGCFS